MRAASWLLGYEYRCVRMPYWPPDPTAPCGCGGADQRTYCFDMDGYGDDSYTECLGCGAVWQSNEGYRWETYECDDLG